MKKMIILNCLNPPIQNNNPSIQFISIFLISFILFNIRLIINFLKNTDNPNFLNEF